MMVAITDPQSQHFLAAYFVPYLWFPADPKRPYRIQKNDRYYWGERIDEYRKRVKCGRIAITVAGLPVLFFTSEEKKKVDSINYKIMVRFGLTSLLFFIISVSQSTFTVRLALRNGR